MKNSAILNSGIATVSVDAVAMMWTQWAKMRQKSVNISVGSWKGTTWEYSSVFRMRVARLQAASNKYANVRCRYAPVRARLARKPCRRICRTIGFVGGFLFCLRRWSIRSNWGCTRTVSAMPGRLSAEPCCGACRGAGVCAEGRHSVSPQRTSQAMSR